MKNYRKYLVPFILIILIAVGISKFNIESVSRHENVNKVEMKGAEATAGESEKTAENSTESNEVSDNKKEENDVTDKNGEKSDKNNNTDLKNSKKNKKKNKSEKQEEKKKSDENSGKTDKKSLGKNDGKLSEKKQNKVKKQNDNSRNNSKDKPKKTTAPYKKEQPATKEPEENKEYVKCNITIDCSILLSNMDKLEKNVRKYVPKDGRLLDNIEIKIKKGASVYDVLVAACKEKNIAYDATYSAIYNSSYVKGIGYLYEKMAGDMSGWLYLVDGKTPNVGASAYRINGGEQIEWMYTCSGRAGS